MAFTIKQFNDLRGILFLMLMTIPSIATTNIDCNGKPFHCVNSTHFMICVDLGAGVSETIDDFIIPCPPPTECHNTNRFECEYPAVITQQPTTEPVVITTDQPTIATAVQANEPTVQFIPEILTTVAPDDLYNTVSTTTLSGSELSTPNPTFMTDTTIDVFNTVNVSTSGSHADLEVGGKNTEVLYTTSPTLEVSSETTVSPAITDFAVASTTDKAVIFLQTDSKLNAINRDTTVNPDVAITTPAENKLPAFTTTEHKNLITENKTEINHISELVTENINATRSIQNQAAYTTESLRNVQVENNDAAITKIPLDQLFTSNNQDQLRTDMVKETTVTVTNPLENVLINTENKTTTLNDVPKDHNDAVIKQITEIYATTETLIASSSSASIPSDPSVPTESVILVEPKTFTETKVLVDQEKPRFPVDTQDTTADYNFGNMATATIENSDVITGPSSELHNAVISSTAPTIDTTLMEETKISQDAFYSIKTTSEISTSGSNVTTDKVITYDNNNNIVDNITTDFLPSTDSPILTPDETTPTAANIDTTFVAETTISQDAFYSIKTTSEISTSESNVITDKIITYDNNNNIFDNITTVSLPLTDFPTSTTDETTPPTARNIDTIFIAETTTTPNRFYSIKATSEVSTSDANIMTVDNITTVSLLSTDSPTLTTDEKSVSIEPSNYEYIQNETVVNSLETNLISLSDNSTLVTTEKEFHPTVTKHAVNESNINFVSNVVTQPSKLDSALQQLDDSKKPDSDINVSNLNTQHNMLSNIDLSTTIKTETIITEPTFTETEKNTGNNDVNPSAKKPAVIESDINFVSNVVTQPAKLDPALQQLEVSNKPDSDANVSNLNTQHNILSNTDLSADNIKTETLITEPTFNDTEKNTANNDVNTIIQLVEHYTIIPQPENEKPRIHTTESSNYIVSDSNIIFEPNSLPLLPTESFLYLEAHIPEKATKGQVIESTAADDNLLNSENKNKIDSITNAGSSILSTEATAQYYDVTKSIRKADQLNTVSEMSTITDTPNEKGPDFILDITISELRKNETTGHEIPSIAQDEKTKTQLQESVEVNTLQKATTETTHYSPTAAADSKQLGTEATIIENEQYKIKPIVVDTTASENQLAVATTESVLELNTTVTDSSISESNLLFESSVNVQLPEALSINIINNHNLNAPDISSEKSNKVDLNGYETPRAPITETQTQLREIELNKKQQKETKTISDIAHNIAEYDTISKLPVTESTHVADFNESSRTISSDPILQLTTSSVLEKTKEVISASKAFELIDSTKSIMENSPGFTKNKNDNSNNYRTGELPISSIPTISILGNLDNKVQDHAYPTIATPLNLIVKPIVNSLGTLQYNPNIKPSEGLTTLQTPIDLMTTESKFGSQNNIENINENLQDIAPNSKNTVANIVDNLVPINSNKLSFKTDNVNEPKNQEISVPILEKAVINLTLSSTTEKQKIVPEEFYATTHNTAYINHEPALSESVNNNKKDVIIVTTNNGLPLPELSSIGDLSVQNTYIDKHLIIKQEGPYTKDSVPKQLNNTVVNEGKLTSADIINHTLTSYNDNKDKIIPAEFTRANEIINKSFTKFNNKTLDNSSNLIGFNESDTSALTLTVENTNQNLTVGNNTILSEAEIQIRSKLDGNSSVELVETTPIQTLAILKILPVPVNIKFTPVSNNFNSEKDQTLNSEAVLPATETLKSLQTVSGENNLVKPAPIQTSGILKILPVPVNITFTPVRNNLNSKKDQTLNSEAVLPATETLKSLQTVIDNTVSKISVTEKNNGAKTTHSSIVSSKDEFQKNVKKAPEARVKSLAERDVSTTSNKLSMVQVESSNSQKVNNNAGEAVNLAPFDLILSAKSGGFEEKNNKPSTEKPEDEETIIASGNEGENRKINKESSLKTLSSENVSVTTESVEVDNNGNNNNNIVQSNSKYETLTSKPTIEISTRPTQLDNLINIHLPIVSEVSTQSTVRSTSQKLSLENNTPLPATTKAVTNDFVCLFNQRGRFADKHDCRKFYICHGIPQPLVGICPVFTVFSELRKQCTKNLSHCVRNNQFQCVSEGRFSDFLNDSVYYICAKNKLGAFIRFKLRCQNGYHLNKTSVRCVLNTESISQSISSDISKSNSEQSAALKLEVKSKDSSKNTLECKKEGTFADPDNCRVYYVCKKTSKSGYLRKKKKCDSDEYFHKDKKKCVDAESYECK